MVSFHTNFTHIAQDRGDVGGGGGRERNEMYRRVFSNQSNSYNGALCKQSTIFAKKAPLQIFDWVLNTLLLYQIWILMKGKKDFQQ